MMRTRWWWLLVVGLACPAVLAGQARAGIKTIGQTGAPGASLGTGLYVQPAAAGANPYIVPNGKWMIRSWSTQAGASGGQMALVVFRPTGVANQYKVFGESAVHTLTANVLNTFSTKAPAKRGDLIGLWADASAAPLFGTTDPNDFGFGQPVSQPPSVGTTISVSSFSFSGSRTNISVTLKKGRGSGGNSFPPQ
jgi:hypothetical protein